MAKTPKVRVTGEHHTDLALWFTANYLLGIGVRRKKGRFHPLLAASVFAFFAFEAFLNEVGRHLDPNAWRNERMFFSKGRFRGTLGKFRYLANKAGYTYSERAPPFETVRALAKVRDMLAHGRVEPFDVKVNVNLGDSVKLTPKIMDWGDVRFAKKAIADIETLADGLIAAAKSNCGEWTAGYRSSAFCGGDFRKIHLEELG
jgi:hypothetical protein